MDWIASFRGRDRKSERDATVKAKLQARSNASPVIAQRPIAPIQPIETDEKNSVPMEMISVTDLGAESVTIDDETNQVSEPIQRGISIEEMALVRLQEVSTPILIQDLLQNQPVVSALHQMLLVNAFV